MSFNPLQNGIQVPCVRVKINGHNGSRFYFDDKVFITCVPSHSNRIFTKRKVEQRKRDEEGRAAID